MWTIKSVSRDNQQACVVNEFGTEAWFSWCLIRREKEIRETERMNAALAIQACDIQDAGGCRSYLDTNQAREIAGLLAMQVEAYEAAAGKLDGDLGDAAVAACEMKETAESLVQLAVDMRNHRQGRQTYTNAATDGRWRD